MREPWEPLCFFKTPPKPPHPSLTQPGRGHSRGPQKGLPNLLQVPMCPSSQMLRTAVPLPTVTRPPEPGALDQMAVMVEKGGLHIFSKLKKEQNIL